MEETQMLAGIKDLRPATEVSYNDFVYKLEPLFKAIGDMEFIPEDDLSRAELSEDRWFSDFFAALCTDEASRYTTITTASFDRACQCLGVFTDLKQFIRFLFDLINHRSPLPQFYGFVNDDNARKLLFEENTWLLRFNNDKLLYTVAVKGNNGLELKDHEISYRKGSYTFDGRDYSSLKSLVERSQEEYALTGSPYREASKMTSRDENDYYGESHEVPFRNAWSIITGDMVYVSVLLVAVHLPFNQIHFIGLQCEVIPLVIGFHPDPALQKRTVDKIWNYVTYGEAPHVCRLLRRCHHFFTEPMQLNSLLMTALDRSDNMDHVVDYLFSIGADPNGPSDEERPLVGALARSSDAVRCLLRHPNINVNVCDENGIPVVIKAIDYPEALQLFLNDSRTDINIVTEDGGNLLEAVIYRGPEIEMMRNVIDRGFNLNKSTSKDLIQVLNDRKTTEERISGWKILIEAGVDINAVNDKQQTVLHAAVLESALEEVEALLDLGANVDGSPACPDTPLHLAAGGAVEITGLLLKRGADVNRVNAQGKTAKDLAVFATQKFFRIIPPPLEDFTFVGHRIEFDQQEKPIPARYSAELMIIKDRAYVQGGLYRKLYHASDEDPWWNGAPFMDLWCASLGDSITNEKASLCEWKLVNMPHRDIQHHSYESITTVQVGNEIWFVGGFEDIWVKYNTENGSWSKKDPLQLRKAYVSSLNTFKGYNMSDHILYPSASGPYKVSKKNGKITFGTYKGEEINDGWSNEHAIIGGNIWMKKRSTKDGSLTMYCLNNTSGTWYRAGPVDRDIDGSLVAVGKYLLSTSFNNKAKEMKICVFDTDSMNWTRHAIDIKSGTLALSRKQSMYVHKDRLILFGGQTGEETVTDAMYSIDLSPLLGVKSLAMMSATAVVANQDKLSKEAIEGLPVDLKERIGFVDKK